MRCEEIRQMLPAHVEGRNQDLSVRRHLASCADCRAELARYEQLVAGLSGLRSMAVEPPSGLLTSLVEIPSTARRVPSVPQVREHVVRNRNAYLGGVAVALVGAAGAVLWSKRRGLAAAS